MVAYTIGFAFASDRQRVALIRKTRGPVCGTLTGVGGHVEPGEMPEETQRREFREEAGVDIPEGRWVHTVTLSRPDVYTLHVFAADVTTEEMLRVRTVEDEVVDWFWMRDLSRISPLSPNTAWLIGLSKERGVRFPVEVFEHP